MENFLVFPRPRLCEKMRLGAGLSNAGSLEPFAEIVRSLPDMNADGVPDIFVAGRGNPGGFAVLSGTDGGVLGVNATPKDEIDHLVDARDIDGDEKPDLVFAVRIHDDESDQPADRLCFAVYSGVHYKRVISFKKPFNRLGVRQALLFGGFPDTNADGVPEILCYGESAPFRDRPQEGHFALVLGQQFKHSRRTLAGFDPTTTDSFIACPGSVAPDRFPDLVVSTPSSANMPSQLGLYVLKLQKFDWTLTGGDASAEISKRFGKESGQSIEFGAPIITVPDQDGDGLSDVATICSSSSTMSAAYLVVVSSRSGRILQIETGEKQARIDTDRRRVQLTLLRATDGGATDRIAVTGQVDGTPQPTPAILFFELKGASASHP